MRNLLVMLCAGLTLAFAQMPVFRGPTAVLDAGTPIDVSYYGSPTVHDWDGDGLKDLILGEFNFGNIRFYHNLGSDSNPEFSGFEYMMASGSQIALPYG